MTTINANRADAVAAAGHLLKAHQLLKGVAEDELSDEVLSLTHSHLTALLGGPDHSDEADLLLSESIYPEEK